MDFRLTESQRMIVEMVKKFGELHITPNSLEWDNKQHFPLDVFKKLGDLGLAGVLVPEEYGGSGFSYLEYIKVIEQLASINPSIALSLAAHNSLCVGHILDFASEEQKKKYLPSLSSGVFLGSWALTEPNTGSDAMRMKCVAKKKDNGWIINGTKTWITNAASANIIVLLARTGDLLDSKGITAFIIEKNNPGLKVGKKEDKLGMRSSETNELIFDNCFVKHEDIIGSEGEGFIQAMKVLDKGRISIAALSLGISKGAYNAALKYSKEREQFGKQINQFQAIAFKIADMAVMIESSELLINKACYLLNSNQDFSLSSSIAKYYASESAVKISNEAVQIFGGYGYTKDFPVEKFYRDAKLCTIGEGTSEIQKIVISKNILK